MMSNAAITQEAVARALEASRICAQPWETPPARVRQAEMRRAAAFLAVLNATGWAVVPHKPTRAMVQAAFARQHGDGELIYYSIYRAMVAAVPQRAGDE